MNSVANLAAVGGLSVAALSGPAGFVATTKFTQFLGLFWVGDLDEVSCSQVGGREPQKTSK